MTQLSLCITLLIIIQPRRVKENEEVCVGVHRNSGETDCEIHASGYCQEKICLTWKKQIYKQHKKYCICNNIYIVA